MNFKIVLNYVSCVPSCPTYLRAFIFLRALRILHFLRVLRALIFYVPYLPSFFYVLYVPSSFYVPQVSAFIFDVRTFASLSVFNF